MEAPGASVHDARQLLGHADISTTSRYLASSIDGSSAYPEPSSATKWNSMCRRPTLAHPLHRRSRSRLTSRDRNL